ncbi:hypothetical protein BO70DRAFT_211967 [Aspergillus heteromorphus CBS 117.55]|uniref:Uncharacterized protein n=1 Tax=Aspergillus heteromorphus CBS 117.55 TaxID=1448321 RepID=A0A317WK74_9EURO|nr:uncharacterized protein BO70DRAFT_211967 [Aspergillus heteromorphus CBS 117.55]PWY86866.1 hypothetical protein BO70DRAFT_211967 [Aspergillus heteromorphus CBS 117.55]
MPDDLLRQGQSPGHSTPMVILMNRWFWTNLSRKKPAPKPLRRTGEPLEKTWQKFFQRTLIRPTEFWIPTGRRRPWRRSAAQRLDPRAFLVLIFCPSSPPKRPRFSVVRGSIHSCLLSFSPLPLFVAVVVFLFPSLPFPFPSLSLPSIPPWGIPLTPAPFLFDISILRSSICVSWIPSFLLAFFFCPFNSPNSPWRVLVVRPELHYCTKLLLLQQQFGDPPP